jgi:N-methylhydantoinase B
METLISLSGAVIGKMLACAEPEVARLAIGPAHPVFYGFISGGVDAKGEPFVATNADNMIGSLAASPADDGVDFGGHFWIPEGTASNIEELELLWPMLFLYRRALPAGAGGAGRYRGGRGFVEAGIPWTVPGLAAAVYTDESFPKAVGPFGGNPGAAGHFRLKHGTDVADRFAAGQVPQDFDAIAGAEAQVEAKGPMLMMGADAAWEWTGANAPGFGDPLTRDPAQVRADVATGALPADLARRVYAVLPDDDATRAARAQRLAARLAGAVAPAVAPATVGDGVPLRVLAG